MNHKLCEFLEWDSDFFGMRIARLNTNSLTPDIVEESNKWCKDNRINCLYFLSDFSSHKSIELARAYGFLLVDARITLEAKSRKNIIKNKQEIRPVKKEDIPALKEITKSSFTDTRFYFDPKFPRDKCDQLYEIWFEKSCNGYAKEVLVSLIDNNPTGFITCHVDQGEGNIGLLGVTSSTRGQGVGSNLVEGALNWFNKQRISTVKVVTQGRNIEAQRLYQKRGFITAFFQLWFHRWFL